MSKNYIEQDAAVAYIENLALKSGNDEMQFALMWAAKHLANTSPADVRENIYGHWIDMGDFEQCSVCSGTHLKEFHTAYGKAKWIKSDFCPNCGADLRGDTDEK